MEDALREDIMSLHHRSKEFKDLYKETSEQLRMLFGIPDDFHIFLTASSLENMERVIENTVEKKSLHVITGAFGKKFYEIAKELGKNPESISFKLGSRPNLSTIEVSPDTELLALTQNETSIGVVVPMEEIATLKKKYPHILVALDIVSSGPYLPVDYSVVDIAFLSSQKLLGLPAGLGILIVNDKAIEKAQSLKDKGISIGSVHNFVTLAAAEKKNLTNETPNVLGLYLLKRVLQDMNIVGIDTIRRQTKEKADKIYAYFENHPMFKPYVKDRSLRSDTTIVIDVKGQSEKILEFGMKNGLAIGEGYGEYAKEHIRIANFPSHTIEQVKQLLDVINQYSQNVSSE
jgi:phosphoserine aminotransferase